MAGATESPFIMFPGAHDLLLPTFLERHLMAMQADDRISVSYCHAAWVDEDLKTYRVTTSRGMDTLPNSPLIRFLMTPRQIDFCTEMNNVVRRSFFEPFLTVYGCDMIELASLAYKGPFHCVREPLYMMLRVPETERSEGYMARMTGQSGATEDRDAFFEAFDQRLRRLASGNPLRPLASMILRAWLQKRFTPDNLGLLAKSFNLVMRMKHLGRAMIRPFASPKGSPHS
jgi:hypothetical protein